MACAVAAPVLAPSGDFPAWLEAQGVNAEVARAMDSELGIRDYGVLRACVGDGLVRAELLATARDRLPFGFYAVLRQVVKALQGAESRDGGTTSLEMFQGMDAMLSSLVDVLVMLFSGLSRELSLSVHRLGAMEGSAANEGNTVPTRVIRFGHRSSEERPQQQQQQQQQQQTSPPQTPPLQGGLEIQMSEPATVPEESPLARLPAEPSFAAGLCGRYSPISSAASDHGGATDGASRMEEVVEYFAERESHLSVGEALLQQLEAMEQLEPDQLEPEQFEPQLRPAIAAESHVAGYALREQEDIEAAANLDAAGAHCSMWEPRDAVTGVRDEEPTAAEDEFAAGAARETGSPEPDTAAPDPEMETMDAASNEETENPGDAPVRSAPGTPRHEHDERTSDAEEPPVGGDAARIKTGLPATDGNNSSSNSSSNSSWEDLVAVAVNLAIGTNLPDWKESAAQAKITAAADERRTAQAAGYTYREEPANVAQDPAAAVDDAPPRWDGDRSATGVPAIVPNRFGWHESRAAAGAIVAGTRGSVLVERVAATSFGYGHEVQEVAINLAIGSRHSERRERAAVAVAPAGGTARDPARETEPTEEAPDRDADANGRAWEKWASVVVMPSSGAPHGTWTESTAPTITGSSGSSGENEPTEVAEAPGVVALRLSRDDRRGAVETPAIGVLVAGPAAATDAANARRPWPGERTSAAENLSVVTSCSVGRGVALAATGPPARDAHGRGVEMPATSASGRWAISGGALLNLTRGTNRRGWREEATAASAVVARPEEERGAAAMAPLAAQAQQDARWIELRATAAAPDVDTRLVRWAGPKAAVEPRGRQPSAAGTEEPAGGTHSLGRGEHGSVLRSPPAPAANAHGCGLEQLVAVAVDLAASAGAATGAPDADSPAARTHGADLQPASRRPGETIFLMARGRIEEKNAPGEVARGTLSVAPGAAAAPAEATASETRGRGWEQLLAVAGNLSAGDAALAASSEPAETAAEDERRRRAEEIRSEGDEEEGALVIHDEEEEESTASAPANDVGRKKDPGAVAAAPAPATGDTRPKEGTVAAGAASARQNTPWFLRTNFRRGTRRVPRPLSVAPVRGGRIRWWMEPAAVIRNFKESRRALSDAQPTIVDTTSATIATPAVVRDAAWRADGVGAELPRENTLGQGQRPAVESPSNVADSHSRVDCRPPLQTPISSAAQSPAPEEPGAAARSSATIAPCPVPEVRETAAQLLAAGKPSDEPGEQTAESAAAIVPHPAREKLTSSTTVSPSHGPELPEVPAEKTAAATPSHRLQQPQSLAELLNAPILGLDKEKSAAKLPATNTQSRGAQEQKSTVAPSRAPDKEKSAARPPGATPQQEATLVNMPFLEIPSRGPLRIPVLSTLGPSLDPLLQSILKMRPLSEIPTDGPARIPTLRTPGTSASSRQRQELRVLLERPIFTDSSSPYYESRAIKEIAVGGRIHGADPSGGQAGEVPELQGAGRSGQQPSSRVLMDRPSSGRGPRNVTRIQQRPIVEVSIGDIFPEMSEGSVTATSTSGPSVSTSDSGSSSGSGGKQQQIKAAAGAREQGSDKQESESKLTTTSKQSSGPEMLRATTTASAASSSSSSGTTTSGIGSGKPSSRKHLPLISSRLEKYPATPSGHGTDQQTSASGKQGTGQRTSEAGSAAAARLPTAEEAEAAAGPPAGNARQEEVTARVAPFVIGGTDGPGALANDRTEGPMATESLPAMRSRPLWDELVAVAVNLRDSEQQEMMASRSLGAGRGDPDGREVGSVVVASEPAAANPRGRDAEAQEAAANMQQQHQQQQTTLGLAVVPTPNANETTRKEPGAAEEMLTVDASRGARDKAEIVVVEPSTDPFFYPRDAAQAATSFYADKERDVEGFLIQNMGSSQGTRFLLLQTAWLHKGVVPAPSVANKRGLNATTVISAPTTIWPHAPGGSGPAGATPPPPPPTVVTPDSASDSDTGQSQHPCDACGRTFQRREQLRLHLQLHAGKTGYPCTLCGQVYPTEMQVKAHEQQRHSAVWPHRCRVCDLFFSEAAALRDHMRTHAEERPHACQTCGRSFARLVDLRRHRSFALREDAVVHERAHAGPRPHVCEECGRGFAYYCELKIHARKHAGEKPHRCEACGRTFAQPGNYKRHCVKCRGNGVEGKGDGGDGSEPRAGGPDERKSADDRIEEDRIEEVRIEEDRIEEDRIEEVRIEEVRIEEDRIEEDRIDGWTHELQDAYIQHKKARMTEHEERQQQQQQGEPGGNEPPTSQAASSDPGKSETRVNIRKRKKPVKKIRPEDVPQPK